MHNIVNLHRDVLITDERDYSTPHKGGIFTGNEMNYELLIFKYANIHIYTERYVETIGNTL